MLYSQASGGHIACLELCRGPHAIFDLEITTSLGNDFRISCNVAQSEVDPQKRKEKRVFTSQVFLCHHQGKIYRCCVRSAILYRSETWCLKENEKAILRRMKRAMVRAMCRQKVVDRKTTEEQMNMLGLKETIDRLATANGVRWYGHVLRRDDDSVLRVALNLEVSGKRKRGRTKKTWRKQVEEETEKIGLKKEDVLRRDKWRDGVRAIAEGMG